jgi:putative phage-type endonuclease
MMNELIQNTPEWEEMRKTKIGASEAPIIMGVSPYTTPHQLWQCKLDLVPREEINAGMRRGHDLEDRARQELEKMTGLLFRPQVKFHPDNKWMMASLDAIDILESVIAEIKCPGQDDHLLALQGKIPDKYFPQVQHQLEVCQLPKALYFSFDGEKGVIVEVFRDDKYIKDMLKKEKEFYQWMLDLTPPPLTNRDYALKETPEWENTALQWKSITEQIKSLSEIEEKLRESLISQCHGQSSMGSGIKVAKSTRKGAIEYTKISELKGLDLEKYRKPSSEYWRIS